MSRPSSIPLLAASCALILACGSGSGGNVAMLWVSDAPKKELRAYAGDALGGSGTPTPTITISLADFPSELTVGPNGGLWVMLPYSNKVVRYDAGQLTASGAPEPAATLSVMSGGRGGSPQTVHRLRFDPVGHLWAAVADGGLVRLPDSVLTATGAVDVAPDATLPLAFGEADLVNDPDGKCWWISRGNGSRFASLDRVGYASLSGTGALTPTAELTIYTSFSTMKGGAAFDAQGTLWATGTLTGNETVLLGWFKATLNGDYIPDVEITVEQAKDLGRPVVASDGSLWLTDGSADRLFRLAPEQLTAGKRTVSVPGLAMPSDNAAVADAVFSPAPGGLGLKY